MSDSQHLPTPSSAKSTPTSSRMQKSLRKSYDQGSQIFDIRTRFDAYLEYVFLRRISDALSVSNIQEHESSSLQWHDLDDHERSIRIKQALRVRVQQQDPSALYYFMVINPGHPLSLNILRNLSSDQFVRILDMDAWVDDRLDIAQVLHWLKLHHKLEGGELQAYERFRQLEEEVQIGLLQPYIRGYTPEEYESFPVEIQDRMYVFPGQAYYYDILCEDQKLREEIYQLVCNIQHHHMEFALSLIAHINFSVPHEAEYTALRFREARLDELGFYAHHTARKSTCVLTQFERENLERKVRGMQYVYENSSVMSGDSIEASLKEKHVQEKIAGIVAASTLIDLESDASQSLFLTQIIRMFVQSEVDTSSVKQRMQDLIGDWKNCAMTLLSAAGYSSSDYGQLKMFWEHMLSSISLSLETLSCGNLVYGLEIWNALSTKECLRHAKTVIMDIKLLIAQQLVREQILPASVLSLVRAENYGVLLEVMDTHLTDILGYEDTQRIKGFFNRIPLFQQRVEYSVSKQGDVIQRDSETAEKDHVVTVGVQGASTEENIISSDAKMRFRLEHRSIDSRERLSDVTTQMVAMLCDLCIVRTACGECMPQNYSAVWTRGLASVCLGGRFINRVIDERLAQKLIDILEHSSEQMNGELQRFCAHLPSLWQDVFQRFHAISEISDVKLQSAVEMRVRHYARVLFSLIDAARGDAALLARNFHTLSRRPLFDTRTDIEDHGFQQSVDSKRVVDNTNQFI